MNDRIEDLITLAAMGELTPAESLELDAAADADPAVADELAATLDVASRIHSVVASPPPPSLKASVLDAIASTPQDADPVPVADNVVALSSRRRRSTFLVSAAAALALVVGASVVVGNLGDGGDENPVAAVVEASDASVRRFEGALPGSLTVFESSELDAIVVDGSALPVLADGLGYVLWMIRDDGATAVAQFRPDASGDVLIRFDGVDTTDVVLGITEEDITRPVESPTLPVLATA